MQNANTNEINSLSSSRRIAWTASFSSLSSLALPFQRNGFFFLLLPSSLLPLVRIFISLLGFVLWRLPNWLGAKIAVVMNESRGWVTERIQGAAAAGCVCVLLLWLWLIMCAPGRYKLLVLPQRGTRRVGQSVRPALMCCINDITMRLLGWLER